MKMKNSLFLAVAGLFVGSSCLNGQGEKSIIAEDQPRTAFGQKSSTWTPKSLPQKEADIEVLGGVTNQKELLENLKAELQKAANNNDKKAAIEKAYKSATDDTKVTLDNAHKDPMNAISIINDELNKYATEGLSLGATLRH